MINFDEKTNHMVIDGGKQKMIFTINEMKDIYWAVENYATLIRKKAPEGSQRLTDLKDKIWEQLTEEEKNQIHPERKTFDDWYNG